MMSREGRTGLPGHTGWPELLTSVLALVLTALPGQARAQVQGAEPSTAPGEQAPADMAGALEAASATAPETAPAPAETADAPGMAPLPAAAPQPPALAPPLSLPEKLRPSLALGASYWIRPTYIHGLYLGERNPSDLGLQPWDEASYPAAVKQRLEGMDELGFIEQRLRLKPAVGLGELASLNLHLDVLDGVLWGDNAGLSSVSLFATDPSTTDRYGRSVEGLQLTRAWMELKLPIGLMRIGRMPSQFGMGLLANAGDQADDDFGENRYGSSADRILFATRPGAIWDRLTGRTGRPSNLLLAVGYDKIADHNPGEPVIDLDDPDTEKGFVFDPTDCTGCSPSGHLANPRDDVDEWVLVLYYKDEQADILAPGDVVAGGMYGLLRSQERSDSLVYILDFHLKLQLGPGLLESELLTIQGETSAIKQGNLPKNVDIWGWVVRGGYQGPRFSLLLEAGRASGDDDPFDDSFSGRALHPDHNVGLLLYEEVLAERTAREWTAEAQGFWSRGGVYNSRYLMPKVKWRPTDRLELIIALLWARAEEDTNSVHYPKGRAGDDDLALGWELDGALKVKLQESVRFSLEGGLLFPGRALWLDENGDNEITDADEPDAAHTVQASFQMDF